MCYFIAVAVNEKHELTLRRKLRGLYTLTPNKNSSIANYLKLRDVSFLISTGTCACDLFTKSPPVGKTEENLRQKYSKPKYKKLGWTKAKIERAVADALSKPATDFCGLREDLRWSLCDLVSETKRAAVVVHFYLGDVETEEISITEKKIINCQDLQNNDEGVVEDCFTEIVW